MEHFGDVGGCVDSDKIMERMAFLNMRRLAIRNSKQSVFGGDSQTVVDSSLTSLGWLQNLKVLDLFSPEAKVPVAHKSPSCSEGDWETVSSSDSTEEKPAPHIGISLSPIRKCLLQSAEYRRTPKKFRNNVEKPPYSYTTLIYLAIHHSKSEVVALNDIYRWMKENFKYYRTAEAAWQNSIRHNLSLNELFVKVPRSKGRGNHWKVNPDYEHILSEGNESFLLDYPKVKGKGRKRAHSMCCRDGGAAKSTKNGRKRAKSIQNIPADPCGLPGDLDWVSLLSSQRVSCASCPSPEACRPVFGSPVLGPPDLGHIGDPVVCSPLTVPSSTTSELPSTPVIWVSKSALLEEAVLVQDSPSPNLLPWADSRAPSPAAHPWAESKEMTLNGIRFLCKDKLQPPLLKTMWSPDSSWSLSYSSSSGGSGGFAAKRTTALISGAGIY